MRGLICVVVFILALVYAEEDECGQPADVAFVIDSSTSIRREEFKKQTQFVEKLTELFDIGRNTTQVSALTFGHRIDYKFFFTESDNKEHILEKIRKIEHDLGMKTFTNLALEAARTVLFSPSNGARPNVPRICILLTDGESSLRTQTLEQAAAMKSAGIEIIAVGIGRKINDEELQAVVSAPAEDNFIKIMSFNELDSKTLQRLVKQRACEVIKTTTTTSTTTTTTEPTTTSTTTEPTTTSTTTEPTTTTTTSTTSETTTTTPKTTTTTTIITTPSTTITTSMQQTEEIACQGKEADIVLIVDMSTSIWTEDFKRQRQFLADLVSHFDINSGKTRVALILFSDDAKVIFYLDQYNTVEEITDAIMSIESAGGITNTHLALNLMIQDVMTKEHGSRPSVAHICILITDGISRLPDLTIQAANKIHDSGVYVFAIGVGNMTDDGELRQMATDKDYVITVKDGYKALKRIKNMLAFKTCEVPQGDQARCANDLQADIVYGLFNVGGGSRDTVSEFIKKVGGGFTLSTGKVRIGLIESCGRAELQLQDFESNELYNSAVVQSMETDISTMLYDIRTRYIPSKFEKSTSNIIIILFVSGKIRDIEKANIEAMRLKHEGTIIVFGLDDSTDIYQLRMIASSKDKYKPDMTHAYQLKHPSQLIEKIKEIYVVMCKSQ